MNYLHAALISLALILSSLDDCECEPRSFGDVEVGAGVSGGLLHLGVEAVIRKRIFFDSNWGGLDKRKPKGCGDGRLRRLLGIF